MPERIAVDAAAAGELLGMSERLVRDLTNEGVIPSIDVGEHRNRLYSVDALRAWALERSGYRREEAGSGETREPGRGAALPAKPRRAMGRGRPRSGRSSPMPVRLVPRGGDREAG